MTREELIKGLESVKLCAENESFEWICKPIDEAIKALKRQPCEDAISRLEAIKIVNNPMNIRLDLVLDKLPSVNPIPPKMVGETCEDAVSRAEIIDELNRLGRNAFKDDTDYDSFFAFVDSLPPVTPQSKTAHWIHFANSDDCSGCGWSTGKYISPSDYCPKCGARMIEPAESEVKEE